MTVNPPADQGDVMLTELTTWLRQTATNPTTGEPGWYVPAGAGWCPRCGDTNFDDQRMCITCTHGDGHYGDGRFTHGWRPQ